MPELENEKVLVKDLIIVGLVALPFAAAYFWSCWAFLPVVVGSIVLGCYFSNKKWI